MSIVPNEEQKSISFKTFPKSATVKEGESVTFSCEVEKAPQSGKRVYHFFLKSPYFTQLLNNICI